MNDVTFDLSIEPHPEDQAELTLNVTRDNRLPDVAAADEEDDEDVDVSIWIWVFGLKYNFFRLVQENTLGLQLRWSQHGPLRIWRKITTASNQKSTASMFCRPRIRTNARDANVWIRSA